MPLFSILMSTSLFFTDGYKQIHNSEPISLQQSLRSMKFDWSQPGPVFPPSFQAHVTLSGGSSVLQNAQGHYWHDRTNQRWRSTTRVAQEIFHMHDELWSDQLARNISQDPYGLNQNLTIGKGADQVCKVLPQPYTDNFIGMPGAIHKGSSEVEGEPCEIWTLTTQTLGMTYNISACVAKDGVPRQFNLTSDLAYKALGSEYWTLRNVSIGPLADDIFEPSKVCKDHYPMPPCKDGVEVAIKVYRVRSRKEPNSLENRNVGDALGDMAFFCSLDGMDETQVATLWEVQANSSWGQYEYCQYRNGKDVCFGSTGKQVGRESALGLGKGSVQGQCSPNNDVGSWFSFPAEGMCPAGTPLGTGGCTWSARVVRSVSTSCIIHDRGLGDSCRQERGHAPMLRSAAIFEAALSSADPSRGGCPDVGVYTDHSDELVIV
jgi:hypothetical protein